LIEHTLPENGYFRFGDYYVDVGDNRVFYGDQGRHIEPKAMHVLYHLALCAGETVSRQDLMDKVWSGRVVIEDALTRIISQLRLTFHDNKSRRLIQTVPKKGYRLASDVTWLTRQEFIARSPLALSSPEVQPSSTRHKWMMLAGFSIALVLLFWFFLLPILEPESTDIDSGIEDNEPIATQQSGNPLTTIAFLPWRNLTGDAGNDYLAEMLPEELSISLAKSEQISVLAHYANIAAGGDTQTIESLAEEFRLDYWIEGSITEANEEIRVLVRLIDMRSSKAVWSEVYADDIQQVLQLNARIISDIQTQLFGTSTQGQSPVKVGEIDIQAYRAYLKGNYWWMNGKTSEWHRRAESSFLMATDLDPNFAAAFGSLAFIYARYNYHDVYMNKAAAVTRAKSAIDSALKINPTDINAMLADALLAIDDLDFERAERLLNEVIELEPKNARGLYVYSELSLAQNQMNKALINANSALKADPLSPWVNVNLAIVHFWRNEMPQALAAVEQSIKIDRNYTWAYVWKAKILKQMGQLAGAIEAMKACLDIDDGSPVNSIYLALLHKDAGSLEQAARWFAHTASLYGDSPDARFWQSYLSLSKLEGDLTITRQLLEQLTIKTTRFFSLEPLKKALLSSQPSLMQAALPEYLSSLKQPGQAGFWVNYHNQYRAYIAIAFMQQLNMDKYEQALEALTAAVRAFENKVPVQLRANIDH
jgi:DNA-binding winged helix-turn-helix (wHTH) protein/TolB-like protein/Tfp pilus assembly protein PilF